jgi:hypothetical protein
MLWWRLHELDRFLCRILFIIVTWVKDADVTIEYTISGSFEILEGVNSSFNLFCQFEKYNYWNWIENKIFYSFLIFKKIFMRILKVSKKFGIWHGCSKNIICVHHSVNFSKVSCIQRWETRNKDKLRLATLLRID